MVSLTLLFFEKVVLAEAVFILTLRLTHMAGWKMEFLIEDVYSSYWKHGDKFPAIQLVMSVLPAG